MATTTQPSDQSETETSAPIKESPAAKADPSKEVTPKVKFKSISPKLKETMTHEINLMLLFALHNGITVNVDVIPLVEKDDIDNLIHAHNLLCLNVAPATPKSINYSFKLRDRDIDKSLLRKLPLVRNLIILALIFLATFILTGQSSMVNDASLDLGVMNNRGISLLVNLSYLASVSGLGIIFYLLKNVSKAVKNGTLIPEDTIYYVALVVLGVISGLILSEILSVYVKDADKINLFNKSVLALVGGFSSDAIFSVLQGIIDRIKGLFGPVK